MSDTVPLIRDVVEAGGSFRLYGKGSSMLPTIREGEDVVTLVKADRCAVGDIVLYRRNSERYVLHRIIAIESDGNFTMRGDNQRHKEFGVSPSAIIAVAEGFTHRGKYFKRGERGYYPKTRLFFHRIARNFHSAFAKIRK